MQRSGPATMTFVGILPTSGDEIFHEANKTTKRRIIKGRWLRWVWRLAVLRTVYIVYRDPHCKMTSVWVKEALHSILYLGRHTGTLSVMEPVLSGIICKGEAVGDVSDVNIGLEQGAEISLRKDCVGRLRRDVILAKVPFVRLGEAFRGQKLLYGVMRKLYDANIVMGDVGLDNSDQGGTRRQHGFICISRTQVHVQPRNAPNIMLDCQDLRQLIDTEWMTRERHALEKSNGILLLLLIDFKQYSLIRFVQCARQFIQGTPNAGWKAPPQFIQLADNPSEPTSCPEPSW